MGATQLVSLLPPQIASARSCLDWPLLFAALLPLDPQERELPTTCLSLIHRGRHWSRLEADSVDSTAHLTWSPRG